MGEPPDLTKPAALGNELPVDSLPRLYTGHVPPGSMEGLALMARMAHDLGSRYRFWPESFLGRGAYATVWAAEDRVAGCVVAIKRFEPCRGRNRNFYRELAALFRLGHPRIVRPINLLETDEGIQYLLLEYCAGGSLRRAISVARQARESGAAGGYACDPARAAAVGLDMATALVEAHRLGLVHRDIKPENVLFAESSRGAFGGHSPVKLADFGLAKMLRTAPDPANEADGALQGLSGSPAYMAPEQFSGVASRAVDIYALGVILYELLHLDRPFGGTLNELVLAHLNATPKFRSDLPTPWQSLLSDLLAKAPSHRPTADQVVERLEAIVRGGLHPPSAQTAPLQPLAKPIATVAHLVAGQGVSNRPGSVGARREAAVHPTSVILAQASEFETIGWAGVVTSLVATGGLASGGEPPADFVVATTPAQESTKPGPDPTGLAPTRLTPAGPVVSLSRGPDGWAMALSPLTDRGLRTTPAGDVWRIATRPTPRGANPHNAGDDAGRYLEVWRGGPTCQVFPLGDTAADIEQAALWLAPPDETPIPRVPQTPTAQQPHATLARINHGGVLAVLANQTLTVYAIASGSPTGPRVATLWQRDWPAAGLASLLTALPDGRLVASVGVGRPRLVTFDDQGRTVGEVALPGPCWSLASLPVRSPRPIDQQPWDQRPWVLVQTLVDHGLQAGLVDVLGGRTVTLAQGVDLTALTPRVVPPWDRPAEDAIPWHGAVGLTSDGRLIDWLGDGRPRLTSWPDRFAPRVAGRCLLAAGVATVAIAATAPSASLSLVTLPVEGMAR